MVVKHYAESLECVTVHSLNWSAFVLPEGARVPEAKKTFAVGLPEGARLPKGKKIQITFAVGLPIE